MAREMLDIPASNPDNFITFPRFTGRRFDTVLVEGFKPANFLYGLFFIIFQPQDWIYNMAPGFGTTYLFTAPLIIFGLAILIFKLTKTFKKKHYSHMFLVFAYFLASFVTMGTLEQNVNRISVVYPCVVLLITLAICEIARRKQFGRYMAAAICAFTIVSFIGFSNYYFGERYREDFGRFFFYSFGDAMTYAMDKTDDTVYVTTHHQNMPGIKTLFYSGMPPEQYYSTVVFFDPDVEFRWEASFDRFIFGTPIEKNPNAIFVIDHSELNDFDPQVFERQDFRFYSVMYPVR